MPVGGGISGIILIVIIVAIFFFLNGGLGGGGGTSTGAQPGPVSTALASCQTGEDANNRQDCRIVGFVNSIQAYWTTEFPKIGQQQYVPAQTTLFSGSWDTGCGQATAEVGPFYCPNDKNVYIDLGFFDVLEQQFGGSAAPLSQGYVMAHEYGHHVQDLLGTLAAHQSNETGPLSPGVRLELQADCYAGVWAGNAVSGGYLEPITDQQIADALSAASAVGDDRIQQATQGRANPDSWTHGSSEQRQRWFTTGYRGADPKFCDTFGTNNL